MLVACLGRTPLLFFDFLSSLSKRDDRSMFTFTKHRGEIRRNKKKKSKRRLSLVIVAKETKGDYQLPLFFLWQGQKHLLRRHHGN